MFAGCRIGGTGSTGAPAAKDRHGKVAVAVATQEQVDAAVARVFPALIRIYVVSKTHGDGREQKAQGAGSGAIISPDGYAVTNHHVVGKAKYIRVSLANREEVEADLVGTDPLADIAVIKLKPETMRKPVKAFPFARWGDSSKLRVGDVVLAMGSPGALSQSVTQGIVSNTELVMPGRNMSLDGEPVGSLVRWIAHDAVIFPGNSGGPLVDLGGRIVGVNEIGVASLGGAIPANLARSVCDQLIAQGTVVRSTIGLEVRPLLRGGESERGVLVNGVVPASPADKAGLKPGDVILSYDGQPVHVRWAEELPVFNRMVLETPVGRIAKMRVLRDGKETDAELVTAERSRAREDDEELPSWGATMRDLSDIDARERRRANTDGVLVSSIRPGGPSGQAKPQLLPGDIIVKVGTREVKTLAELREAGLTLLGGKTHPVITVVTFDRGTQRLLTAVEVGPEGEESRSPEVRKAWFPAAVQVFTRDLARAMGLDGRAGVLITQLYPGGSAEKAGFQLGDIVTHVDGQPVEASQPEDAQVFPTMIRRFKIGTEVEMTVIRDGKTSKMKVELVQAPVPVGEMKRQKFDCFEFTGRDVAFFDKANRGWEGTQSGIYVEAVEQAGWAALAGLHVGDLVLEVAGREVANVEGMDKVVEELAAARPTQVVFFVRRGVHTLYLELEPEWRGGN
jgi:serine protease Do